MSEDYPVAEIKALTELINATRLESEERQDFHAALVKLVMWFDRHRIENATLRARLREAQAILARMKQVFDEEGGDL